MYNNIIIVVSLFCQVQAALEREGLDSPDLFEDILGTNKEKKAKSNS